MKTLDILISVKDSKIVRIKESLPEPREGVKYIICFQYTDDKYLDLIPSALEGYPDVTLLKRKEIGLSNSRNTALSYATSDLILFLDDDTILVPYAIDNIFKTFESNPDIDMAIFQSQSYAGKLLRDYPTKQKDIRSFKDRYKVLAYEVVCKREKIQGQICYNTKFGLGSTLFTCFEQQVFLEDALRKNLVLRYFPLPLVKTSAIYKPRLVLVDKHVQRALGGLLSYVYGKRAIIKGFSYVYKHARRGKVKFFPFLHAVIQGISIQQRNRA